VRFTANFNCTSSNWLTISTELHKVKRAAYAGTPLEQVRGNLNGREEIRFGCWVCATSSSFGEASTNTYFVANVGTKQFQRCVYIHNTPDFQTRSNHPGRSCDDITKRIMRCKEVDHDAPLQHLLSRMPRRRIYNRFRYYYSS
jgi:hypothetical protein